MNEELYSNYVNREPHQRNVRYIRNWHGRLLALALQTLDSPSRVLEIGPGHGYFAEQCRDRGLDYFYCDTSPSVHRKMSELGFDGVLGLVTEVADGIGEFDLIWMSHVLEHSPSWIDARAMVDCSRKLLSENGALVVVSPDLLSWGDEFWNVDWSHGYPTTIRNVAQLLSDVGFNDVVGRYHRNGSFSLVQRAVMSLLSMIPHRLVDRLLTPSRHALGDGMMYSWKVVFGWRQIFIRARK
jgi:hypothetical protein